ncbi:uncharacterized protein LOC109534839 [Dendroctonus ponderosae]
MAQPKAAAQTYSYFDTPDGEETGKKLLCVLRTAVPASISVALGNVMLYSHPKGIVNTGLKMASITLPMVGIASTFVLATNGLASIRKKDDHLNWFLGGFLAGSCTGLWRRNRMFGFNMGMLGGILAAVRKELLVQGWDIVPQDYQFHPGGPTFCLMDYSLTKERPKNWTTGPSP